MSTKFGQFHSSAPCLPAIISQGAGIGCFLTMPSSSFMNAAKLKRAKALEAERQAVKLRKIQEQMATRIQCTARMKAAMQRTVALRMKKPRSANEILEERQMEWLEERRRTRKAGYSSAPPLTRSASSRSVLDTSPGIASDDGEHGSFDSGSFRCDASFKLWQERKDQLRKPGFARTLAISHTLSTAWTSDPAPLRPSPAQEQPQRQPPPLLRKARTTGSMSAKVRSTWGTLASPRSWGSDKQLLGSRQDLLSNEPPTPRLTPRLKPALASARSKSSPAPRHKNVHFHAHPGSAAGVRGSKQVKVEIGAPMRPSSAAPASALNRIRRLSKETCASGVSKGVSASRRLTRASGEAVESFCGAVTRVNNEMSSLFA